MPLSDNRLTERMQAAIRAALRGAGITRVIVACSGGGDSVCLAHAAAMVARKEGWQIALGHIRHGVRADDGEDAALVERLALDLAVPVFLHQHRPETGAADEASLRQARYTALAAMATEFSAAAILTGHTQDDQAETMLLRLLRGAGVDGLAGIAPDAPFPVPTMALLRVLRPLLAIARAETRAYCAAHGLPYLDDPTNADVYYARNWVRHTVLPILEARYPGAPRTLARTAALVREDAAFLHALTIEALARCVVPQDVDDVTVLSRDQFTRESPTLQRRILRLLLYQYEDRDPRADRVEAVRRVANGSSTQMLSVGGVALWPAYRVVTIGKRDNVIARVRQWALRVHPLQRFTNASLFDEAHTFPRDDIAPSIRFRLVLSPWHEGDPVPPRAGLGNEPPAEVLLRLPQGAILMLRNRLPGDRFRPVGARGSQKLQDYFTEMAVPARIRDEAPLLVQGDDIIAVVGYDVSASFVASMQDATHLLMLQRTEGRIGV